MNPALTEAQTDALLAVLYEGILRIRLAAGAGDSVQAEAIADAIHNVPFLLKEGPEWGWSIDVQREVFLIPLVERYPELAGLVTALRAHEGAPRRS
jgi:hypothetical protein